MTGMISRGNFPGGDFFSVTAASGSGRRGLPRFRALRFKTFCSGKWLPGSFNRRAGIASFFRRLLYEVRMKIVRKSCAAFVSACIFAVGAFGASNSSSSISSGGVKTVNRVSGAAVSSPSDAQFAAELGNALENGTAEDALKLFEGHSTDDPGLLSLKASLLLSSGDVKSASALASKLLKDNPEDIDILTLNVMTAKQSGDTVKKNQCLRKIIALDPKNPDANIELGDEQALRKDFNRALGYYRTAWMSEATNTTAWFGYGKMNYYLSKDKDARRAFERILAMDPENDQALAYLGKLEGENKKYKSAKEYIDRAIAINPNSSDYYLDLGTYDRFLGKYDEAEGAWQRAVELDPNYFLGYAYLAGLYDEQEKEDKAFECYKQVVLKNPGYYYAYESIGMHAWRTGDFEFARKAFLEAAKYNAENVSYPLMVTACLYKQNKVKDARDYSESVYRKIQDKSSVDYKMLRMYHDQMGDNDVTLAVQKLGNNAEKGNITSNRGKYLYYLALYYDIKGDVSLAQKFYAEICAIQSPMFFEYRLAKWSLNPDSDEAAREVGKK